MTWRRIFATYAVAALLGAYLYAQSGGREQVPEQPIRALVPLIEVASATIDSLKIETPELGLFLERRGGRWEMVRPPGVSITSDLVEALLETLSTIPPIEVVAEDRGSDAQFGLDEPAVVIAAVAGAQPVAAVEIGERSPTKTAVYARLAGRDTVYLLGLNARYYADLLIGEYQNKAEPAD